MKNKMSQVNALLPQTKKERIERAIKECYPRMVAIAKNEVLRNGN